MPHYRYFKHVKTNRILQIDLTKIGGTQKARLYSKNKNYIEVNFKGEEV